MSARGAPKRHFWIPKRTLGIATRASIKNSKKSEMSGKIFHREASTLICKIRSCTGRTDLMKKAFSAYFCLSLRSVLPAQDRILKIRVLASLGFFVRFSRGFVQGKIITPPPTPISGHKAFFRGGGWGWKF